MKNDHQLTASSKSAFMAYIKMLIIAVVIGVIIAMLLFYRYWGRYWLAYDQDGQNPTAIEHDQKNPPSTDEETAEHSRNDVVADLPAVMMEIIQTEGFELNKEPEGFAIWYRHESEYQDANVPFSMPYGGKNVIVKNKIAPDAYTQVWSEVETILKDNGYQRDGERNALAYHAFTDIWTDDDNVLEIMHSIVEDNEDDLVIEITYLGKITDVVQVEKEQSLTLQTIAKYNRGELDTKGFTSGRYLAAIEDFTSITDDVSGKHHTWVMIGGENPQYMYYTIDKDNVADVIYVGSVFSFDDDPATEVTQKLRSIINCDLLDAYANDFPHLASVLTNTDICLMDMKNRVI